MSAQLRLIRSRYKAMCASLGVRARLMRAPAPAPAAGAVGAEAEDGPGSGEGALAVAATDITAGSQDSDAADVGAEKRRPKRQQKKTVWPLAGRPASAASAQAQGFSF